MQMPTTPFGAEHFALRFWLTAAAAPSAHSTEARISSGPHESASPFSCTSRILTVPGGPCSPRSPLGPCVPAGPCGPMGPGGPIGPSSPRVPSAPRWPVVPCGPCGPAGPTCPGTALRPLEAARQQQQRSKCDEQPGPSHDILPVISPTLSVALAVVKLRRMDARSRGWRRSRICESCVSTLPG